MTTQNVSTSPLDLDAMEQDLLKRTADHIEALEVENKRLKAALTEADNCPHWQCTICRPKVRAALEHQQKGEGL